MGEQNLVSLAFVHVLIIGRNDFYTSQSMQFHSIPVNTMVQVSPTPVFKSGAARTFGKENARPSQSPLRSMFSANVYPPHFFHDQSFNPLYHHSHAHTFNGLPESTFGGDFKPVIMGPPSRPLKSFYGAHDRDGHGVVDVDVHVDSKANSPFGL